MTFSIIQEKLREWINEQFRVEDKFMFIPDFCQIGEQFPHSIHTSESKNLDIVQMLNTVVDLQIICGSENEKHFERIFESLKILTKNLPKDITEKTMIDFADKVTRALNRLEQLLKSELNSSDLSRKDPINDFTNVLEAMLKQMKALNKQVADLEKHCEENSKQILKLNQAIMPIIERCDKSLTMSMKVLKKLENKLI